MEVLVPILLGFFGLGVGLWFSGVLRMDAATGQASTLWERVRAGVLFVLVGTVPGAIQSLAVTTEGGVYTMAAFLGCFGLALVIGFFLPQRLLGNDLFAVALSQRVRSGAGSPTPLEVFAFSAHHRYGPEKAKKLLHLKEKEYETKYQMGINEIGDTAFSTTDVRDRAMTLDLLCGVPLTQVARDHGASPRDVMSALLTALSAPTPPTP